MKIYFNIIFAAVSACLLTAGIAMAQAGPDGNLTYTLSNNQANGPLANNPETFIIRNRLDSGCTWTVSGDAMIMTRSGGKSSTLLQNADEGGGGELFNSQDFNFPWVAGPRVGIVGEDILFGCDVEASFFDLEWLDSKPVPIGESASLMVFNQQFGPTLIPGDTINFKYLSQLRSGEINLRHPLWERLSVLLGFRYVELHEVFSSSLDVLGSDERLYNVNVDNHLYGGQIGLNVAFINRCRFSIEGVIKAGVFGNYSDLDMAVPDRLLGDKTSHTAVMGEIGLMGIIQVTNHLSLRGGYQAMWLDGIAIAIDQVENVNPDNPKPYMGGSLLYHGATAGVEYAF